MNIFIIDKIEDFNQEGVYYYISDLNKFYTLTSNGSKVWFKRNYIKYLFKQWIEDNVFKIDIQPFAGYTRGASDLEIITGQSCQFNGPVINHAFMDYIYCKEINPIKIENRRAILWGINVHSFKYSNIKIPEVLAIMITLKVFLYYLKEFKTRLNKISRLALLEEIDNMLRILKLRYILHNVNLDIDRVYLQPIMSSSTYTIYRDEAEETLKYLENLLGVNGNTILKQVFPDIVVKKK